VQHLTRERAARLLIRFACNRDHKRVTRFACVERNDASIVPREDQRARCHLGGGGLRIRRTHDAGN
jgi:hypothetical protein